uniref:Uncharacterized protein n=1 Tax=Lepeophtheirus salmonis TaxID=72036 RepID=A0A0K2T5G7_LEPSM
MLLKYRINSSLYEDSLLQLLKNDGGHSFSRTKLYNIALLALFLVVKSSVMFLLST